MTTPINNCQTARRIGLFLLLLGGSNGVMASAADGVARNHLCEGPCASCQKSTSSQAVPWPSEHGCVRAGDPHRVAWWAKPSRNKRDVLGYVGGSASWRGEPRLPDEGTWGLDYAGVFSQNHIWLKWLHGRPSRQAGGSYNTDGPHFLSH